MYIYIYINTTIKRALRAHWVTELCYEIRLEKYTTELYHGNILRNYITEWHGIALRNHITGLYY